MEEDALYMKYREKRMEEAVYVAAELFLKRGIHAVKMTDVADEAAMGVVSLYRYFGSKTVLAVRAGAMLWRDVSALYESRVKPAALEDLTGIERMRILFSAYEDLFREHRDFVAFEGELDRMLKTETVPPEELQLYKESLMNFYPYFLDAFRRGEADGTIRRKADPLTVYQVVCHTVWALSQKLIKGVVLQGFRPKEPEEMHMVMEMALAYLASEA